MYIDDAIELRYKRCAVCTHEFIQHYSTYTVDSTRWSPFKQGCGIEYTPSDEKYVPDEEMTMTSKILKCPCRGFGEVVKRNEIGHPLQLPHA